LRVFGRREDGYHDIHSLFWRRHSPEVLEIARTEGPDKLSVEGVDVPGENLLLRTCFLLRSLYGDAALPFLDMKLHKRLPVGSGLGAGSGNAAALVRYFYQAARVEENDVDKARKIASLGADVAFLASDFDLALADGLGERLIGLGDREWDLSLQTVVFIPVWSSDTGDAYAALDRLREADASFFTPMSAESARNESLALLRRLSARERPGLLPNDFIACDSAHAEQCRDLYRVLDDAGALAWGLCGSGSSCFAVFDEKKFPGAVSKVMFRLSAEESSRFAWLHKTMVLE
jgi:4-diphosphocytidyl-2-C-methyl-D-erythritol kinase